MTQNKSQFTAADLTLLLSTTTPNDTLHTADSHTTATRRHQQQQQAVGSGSSPSQADVMLEAFQLFDPHNRGYVDTEHLMAVLMGLGVAEVTRGDVQLLVEQNDRDKDGKIGLNDFKRMVNAHAVNSSSSATAKTASAV